MSSQPNQNLAAEEALLGALLASTDAFDAVTDVGLRSSHFQLEPHRLIFEALEAESSTEAAIDLLRRDGELEKVGGLSYLEALKEKVPAIGNARHYAEIVKKCALRAGVSEDPSVTELFEAALERLAKLRELIDDKFRELHVGEMQVEAEAAEWFVSQIRTRLRGCWLDPDTDEENIGPNARMRDYLEAFMPPLKEGPLTGIIDRMRRVSDALDQVPDMPTCKTTVTLSMSRHPLALAAMSPSVSIEVETSGMGSEEVDAANKSARDVAEDLADFFTPKVAVAKTA